MKRLQVHMAIEDLAQSGQFCETLFAATPMVVKDDFAKLTCWISYDVSGYPLDGPVPAPAALLRRPHLPPRAL